MLSIGVSFYRGVTCLILNYEVGVVDRFSQMFVGVFAYWFSIIFLILFGYSLSFDIDFRRETAMTLGGTIFSSRAFVLILGDKTKGGDLVAILKFIIRIYFNNLILNILILRMTYFTKVHVLMLGIIFIYLNALYSVNYVLNTIKNMIDFPRIPLGVHKAYIFAS